MLNKEREAENARSMEICRQQVMREFATIQCCLLSNVVCRHHSEEECQAEPPRVTRRVISHGTDGKYSRRRIGMQTTFMSARTDSTKYHQNCRRHTKLTGFLSSGVVHGTPRINTYHAGQGCGDGTLLPTGTVETSIPPGV